MDAKKITGVVALVAIIGIGLVVWYLNRPAAEEASIENALEALTPTEGPVDDVDAFAAGDAPTASPSESQATEGEGGGNVADVSGTWVVDTEIGEFDFADATSTFAGFRVAEELQQVGQTEAVGRTPAVSGELVIDGTTVTDVTVEADFTQMVSDVPRRDDAMKRAMGVDAHPTGTFTLTQPVDLGEIPAEGETITFTAVGDLTVNGMTNPVEVAVEAQIADGNLLAVGRSPVVFADYGIQAPQAGPVISIADEGTIELQLWFTPEA
ncbi:YceI family protein [Euzebya sp.]|uniref:YceI family protein n=1 Tax=Euzebya sp. TaxID=1971409 RepID=UPI00351258A3